MLKIRAVDYRVLRYFLVFFFSFLVYFNPAYAAQDYKSSWFADPRGEVNLKKIEFICQLYQSEVGAIVQAFLDENWRKEYKPKIHCPAKYCLEGGITKASKRSKEEGYNIYPIIMKTGAEEIVCKVESLSLEEELYIQLYKRRNSKIGISYNPDSKKAKVERKLETKTDKKAYDFVNEEQDYGKVYDFRGRKVFLGAIVPISTTNCCTCHVFDEDTAEEDVFDFLNTIIPLNQEEYKDIQSFGLIRSGKAKYDKKTSEVVISGLINTEEREIAKEKGFDIIEKAFKATQISALNYFKIIIPDSKTPCYALVFERFL